MFEGKTLPFNALLLYFLCNSFSNLVGREYYAHSIHKEFEAPEALVCPRSYSWQINFGPGSFDFKIMLSVSSLYCPTSTAWADLHRSILG